MTGSTFLSWTRLGITPDAAPEDQLTGALPGYGATTIGVVLNALPELTVPARLYGPGDVVGLDTRQVIGCYPAAGTESAPAEFFPLVEFDRPDLPWMFTPARAQSGERLRPWLVLVVVDAATATIGSKPGALLPVLTCPARELPEPSESWAWAHAQVSTDDLGQAGLAATLTGEEDRSLSRLLCPRRLQASHRYLAAVVPAFEAGRRRGLGLPVSADQEAQLGPAWSVTPGDAEVDLPVYHHWEFGTAAGGDFASLAAQLQARPMPQDFGLVRVDVSNPGYGMPPLSDNDPGATLAVEGVLRGPLTVPPPWDATAASRFATALTPALQQRPDRLGPPLYGAAAAHADGPIAWPQWLRDLNLDPRYRIAAAYGGDVVRAHQEQLVASAWDQASAVARANGVLRQGQLARTAASLVHQTRIFGAANLGDGHVLQVTSPVHGSVDAAEALKRNPEVSAALTTSYRKQTRPGGVLARRLAPDNALATPVAALANRSLTVNPPLRPAGGMLPLNKLVSGLNLGDLANLLKPLWWEADPTGTDEQPVQTTYHITAVGAAMPQRVFAVAAGGELLSRGDDPVSWVNHGNPGGQANWRRAAVGVPTAIEDLAVFVRVSDGSLASLEWNGDAWAWADHDPCPGGAITGDPLGLSRAVKPGQNHTREPWDSVYVTAADGHLWELLRASDASWHWIDLGMPSAPVTGSVGGSDWQLHAVGTNNHLYRLWNDGTTWTWRDLSGPAAQLDPAVAPVTWNGGIVCRTTAGGLVDYSSSLPAGFWLNVTTSHPVTSLAGAGADLMIVGPEGRVTRYRADGPGPLVWPATGYPTLLGLSGTGILRNGEVWIAADDHVAVSVAPPGAVVGWRHLEPASPGGIGDTSALPPSRPTWRTPVGLMSNLVVAHADNPEGSNAIQLRVGHDLGFDATVRGGWTLGPTPSFGHADKTQGLGLAAGRITNTIGMTDVVAFWVEEHPVGQNQANVGVYQVGRNLTSDGSLTWDANTFTVPSPFSTAGTSSTGLTASSPVQGCDVALCDLDADGRPELLVAYASGLGRDPAIYYRVGWHLDLNGAVTAGWSDSIPVTWLGRTGKATPEDPVSPPIVGLGVAVADVNGDHMPDLVIMIVEQTDAGLMASYRIGYALNARGIVTGGWSPTLPVGPGPIGSRCQGLAIAIADFTGTAQPDLLVMHIEDLPTANKAYYRVGYDLDSGTGRPRVWTEPREADPGGWWGWENQGLGIAIADLDDALLQRRRDFAAAFRNAATAHLSLVGRAQPADVGDGVPEIEVAPVVAVLAGALDPRVTVTNRVLGRLSGIDQGNLPASADRLSPLAFAPSFPQPMAVPLLEQHPELLLPGTDGIPQDTVAMLRPNTTFIEAYLVGANHELSRELLWRGFPGDRRATCFRQFWDHSGADPAAGRLPDIPPIESWSATSALGTNCTDVGTSWMVLLAVRGELLRRFPDAQVYACRAAWQEQIGGPRVLTAQTLLPQFRHVLPPDLTLFGFPFSANDACGQGSDPGWFFVFAEHPSALRFGVEPPTSVPVYGTAPDDWDGLDWARLTSGAAALDATTFVPLHPPFGSVSRPARAGGPQLTWARNSAQLGHIMVRNTEQYAVHAAALLPAVQQQGWTVTGALPDGAQQPGARTLVGVDPLGEPWRLPEAHAVEAARRGELFELAVDGRTVPLTLLVPSGEPAHLAAVPNGGSPDPLLIPVVPGA